MSAANPSRVAVIGILFSIMMLALSGAGERAGVTSDGGFVWKIEGGRSDVFLAGALHMLKKSDHPLPSAYHEAYRKSDLIVFETVPGDRPKEVERFWRSRGVLPHGETIRDHLDSQTYLKLIDYLSRNDNGILTQLEKLEPWRASLLLTQRNFERLGLKATYGIDRYFSRLAKRDGKRVIALEDIETQLGPIADWDKKGQVQMLVNTIGTAPQLPAYTKRLGELLRSGSSEGYLDLRETAFSSDEATRRAMYEKRHEVWAEKLVALADRRSPSMVVVGIDHLLGESHTVMSIFEKQGLRVRRVRTGSIPIVGAAIRRVSDIEEATAPGAAARLLRVPSVRRVSRYPFLQR